MKPTNTNIAKFYGLTRQTIGTYKNSKELKEVERYIAFKDRFEKVQKDER